MLISEPGLDGVFRHVEGIAHWLLRADVPVALAYSSRRGSDRLNELVLKVASSANGATLDLGIDNRPGPEDLMAMLRLWAFVKQWRPSVLHAHSSKAGALARCLAAIGMVHVPVVYTPNAYYGMNAPRGFRRTVFNTIERILGSAGVTIHVSSDEARFAKEILCTALSSQLTLHNAVDFEVHRMVSAEQRFALRRDFGIPVDATVVGSVGRLSWQKDPLTFARAFSKAAFNRPDLFLLVLGRGEYATEFDGFLKRAAPGRWKRIDYLSDPRPVYQVMDYFVLSSRYEGLAFSVLEALAMGIPAVLSDAPGNRCFGELPLVGIRLFPMGDAEALAAALETTEKRGRELYRQRIRESAKRLFSSEVAQRRLQRLYRSCGEAIPLQGSAV